MNPHLFRFKQFSILQEKSAMKIGTDGVLLGAWATAENPEKILDVGTGTGLILLMLAQRFPDAELTGIEIDQNAFEEARFNISESIFKDRCKILHLPVQEFRPNEKFDLVVSNPPFFDLTHQESSSRNIARQQSALSFDELLNSCSRLMADHGKAAFIIPHSSEEEFLKKAGKLNLFPEKITRVKGTLNSPFKRSLILFSKIPVQVFSDELIIETARNVYTGNYIQLTKDFYLKM